MNGLTPSRLEQVVYSPRQHSLVTEYANYVKCPSLKLTFDLLPHADDVAHFPPFRDIIQAPEGTQMSDKPFESAFAQLPDLVEEWRNKLDAKVAELVKIPSHLSSKGTFDGRVVASGSTNGSGSSQTGTDKLRLACALFCGRIGGLFTHPEVFATSVCDSMYPRHVLPEHDSEARTGSISNLYGIQYVVEAPYVIRASGLDPNVATAVDIDSQNDRLMCLSCKYLGFKRWRDAVCLIFYCIVSVKLSVDNAEQ